MNKINSHTFDIGYMDTLASSHSFLHRLDPRSKVITTLVFIVAVVSFDKYALSALIPFFIFPVVLMAAGNLPAGYLWRKVYLVSPFAVLVGIFNPLVDRELIHVFGSVSIPGGWISFLSIVLRFVLTVLAALILVASTGFNAVCLALDKLGLPRPFVVQMLFLYRYLFVLSSEAERMARARALRTFAPGAMKFKVFVSLAGQLLLRTLDRAERIYLAMCCRGFDGHVRMIRPMSISSKEILFLLGWSLVFVALRFYNIPLELGKLITGG